MRPTSNETHKSTKYFRYLDNDLSDKGLQFYKIQFILFLLTPVTRYIDHAFTSTDHFIWWCQKWSCAEWEFKGLTGSATIENKGTCWKTIIGISFVSFVMFLLLRLLILTWISEFELGHSTQHHYSAQIVFDMHEFKLFPFIHALRYQLCAWYQIKEEKMLLIMKHTVCFNQSAWQWSYLIDITGFLFIGTHCISEGWGNVLNWWYWFKFGDV